MARTPEQIAVAWENMGKEASDAKQERVEESEQGTGIQAQGPGEERPASRQTATAE